jgi:hypothetical protein
MRRLSTLSLVMCLGLLVALTAAVLAGRQQPLSSQLKMLRLTDCEPPCWIGIVPGQTSIEAARKRIGTVFGQAAFLQTEVRASNSPLDMPVWRIAASSSPIVVRLSAHDGRTVDSIGFSFHNGQITVADLHRLLGAPSRMVRWHQNFPYYGLAYGTDTRGLVAFTDISETFHWTQPVRAIVLYANGRLPISPDDLFPWFGFHSLRNYYARMP